MGLRIKEYINSPVGVWYRMWIEVAAFLKKDCRQPKMVRDHTRAFRKNALNEYLMRHDAKGCSSVVYTCITGGYDDINEIATPGYMNPEWGYVCFTDCESDIKKGRIGVWEMRPLAYIASDFTRNNRWHKMHPFELFPECEQSIYILMRTLTF